MKGETHHISEEYLVVLASNLFGRYFKAQGLRTNNNEKIYIYKDSPKHKKNCCLHNLSLDFCDGDIFKILPNGEIKTIFNSLSNETTILYTEKCNQNCIMCAQANDTHAEEKMIKSLNQKLIPLLVKRKIPFIGISGGEPTLKLDDLIDNIRYINARSKKTRIEILTNATIFSHLPNVKKLVDNNCCNLSFHIPLYSDSEKIHNDIVGKKNFYKTIRGIYNLAKYKFPIEIRNVITKVNYKRLNQWADFVSHNFPFVFHVALMGLELTGNAKKNLVSVWIEPEKAMEYISQSTKILERANLALSIYNYPLCVLPDELQTYYAASISDWKQQYSSACNNCSKKNVCCGYFDSCAGHFTVRPIGAENETI